MKHNPGADHAVRSLKLGCLLAASAALTACGSEDIPELPCESANGIQVICNFTRPEDILQLPDTDYLIVSEMSPFGGEPEPGALSLYDMFRQERIPLQVRQQGAADWGDPQCERPENFNLSPHGIALWSRPDGALQLLIVSHYPREAIELVEVIPSADGADLIWRGCLIPPGAPFINSVTVAGDGTVLATHMFDLGTPVWRLYPQLILSMDTGYVYSWSADSGYGVISGSEGSFPNGIVTGADPDTVYINYYFNDEVKAVNFRTGEVLATYAVSQPDNIRYHDGSLYIASHEFNLAEGSRCEDRETTCPLPYSIHRLDADTFTGGKILSGSGEPFGVATVATPANGWLWMGSYVGDRMARVRLSDLPAKQ